MKKMLELHTPSYLKADFLEKLETKATPGPWRENETKENS